MMKNKVLTYFLVIAVMAVWSVIIYRVIQATNNDDQMPAPSYTQKKESFNDYSFKADTTALLLNYRDPFGLSKPKETFSDQIKPAAIRNSIVKPKTDWSFVTYSGYIRNPSSKRLVAILKINGKNAMLAEGETFEQVKLLKNKIDSIKVSFNGSVKYIVLNSGL